MGSVEQGVDSVAVTSIPVWPVSARGLLRACRPRQWPKNLLVFAAPIAAGQITHLLVFLRTLATSLIFLAASAATYLLNDVLDAPEDRLHPVKRGRPIAAREVSSASALWLAALCGGIALVGASFLALSVLAIIACYSMLTIAYSVRLKKVAYLEIAIVSAGFVMRAAAGGAASHISLSPWFLVVTLCGAVFIVAGKRSGELRQLGEIAVSHRATLALYPRATLRTIRRAAVTGAASAYVLWAVQSGRQTLPGGQHHQIAFVDLSILPFLLILLRVEQALEAGRGSEPEELVLNDHLLQILGFVCLLFVLLGSYL
jgi:decaprenyl-phosphate phosphoribosyltransferase